MSEARIVFGLRRSPALLLAVVFAAATSAMTSASTSAAEPVIRNLSLRGLQIGGTTTIAVDGDALVEPRLLLPFPAQATLKPESTETRAVFDVALDGQVAAGLYSLRVVTPGGVSSGVIVAVDRFPQRPLEPKVESLPVALHGTVGGSATVKTVFTGRGGQVVLIQAETASLASNLRPVLHLLSPDGVQVAWAWGRPELGGEARLQATLPADGDYTVLLHDQEYAAPAPNHFRLKIGQWLAADAAFPPAIPQGAAAKVEIIGPGGPTSVEVSAVDQPGPVLLPWPAEAVASGPRPWVWATHTTEVLETAVAAGELQTLPGGMVGLSGRLSTPYEQDVFRLRVTPKSKLRLEVFCQRLASPGDVALVVQNAAGGQLARGEDSPGSLDPVLEFTVPDQVEEIRLAVLDTLGSGGPGCVYRLVVEPQEPTAAINDFSLLTVVESASIPVGGATVVPVLVQRRGEVGPIEIGCANLPAGLTLENTTIPAGADGSLVVVRRTSQPHEAALTVWQGTTADGQRRGVFLQNHPLAQRQPWLAGEVALAASTASGEAFAVQWADLPENAGILLGGRRPLRVTLVRPEDDSLVRLTLVASHLPPLANNNQPDLNRALRGEKVVELPAQAKEGEVLLLAPAELPSPVYDLAVRAELLSPDKRLVRQTAWTPVRRLPVRPPVTVELAAAGPLDVPLDPKQGAMVKLDGKVVRHEGFAGAVTITLSNPPPGVRAETVTVPAESSDFAVNLVLPGNLAAGEHRAALVPSAVPDAARGNQRVNGPAAEFVLRVPAPASP